MNTLPPHAQSGNFHFVYELVDPRDMSIFYVGITIDLYERFKQHMRCDGTNVQKEARIQDIMQSGFIPIMRTLERIATEEALDREMYWIRHYLMQGVNLLNIVGVPRNQPPVKPHSTVLVPEGFVRYSTDRFLKKLYFKTLDGELVCFTEATSEQFLAYISQYIDLDDDPDLQNRDWKDQLHSNWEYPVNGVRCRVLNRIRIAGIPMEYYNIYGELIQDQVGHPFQSFGTREV